MPIMSTSRAWWCWWCRVSCALTTRTLTTMGAGITVLSRGLDGSRNGHVPEPGDAAAYVTSTLEVIE